MIHRWACAAALAAISCQATTLTPPPACAVGSLASYIALGGVGCSIGPDVTVFSFQFISTGFGGATLATANNIQVTPVFVGGADARLTFVSDLFNVATGQRALYEINYQADPHPIIDSFDDEMVTFTPVAPGSARIDTSLCIGNLFAGSACNPPGTASTVSVFHLGIPPGQLTSGITFAPVALLGVRNRIDLDAIRGGSADFRSFSNTIGTTLPEPGSILLFSSGLAIIWIQRRRRPPKA